MSGAGSERRVANTPRVRCHGDAATSTGFAGAVMSFWNRMTGGERTDEQKHEEAVIRRQCRENLELSTQPVGVYWISQPETATRRERKSKLAIAWLLHRICLLSAE